MAAMNRSEMSDSNPKPGGELNLDDDSLFAELDSEMMAGDGQGGGDLDFDLELGGDSASTADAGGDLDFDLGSEGTPGGDLDLDLGDVSGGGGGVDDLDLGDLDIDAGAGGSAAGADDEIDLDLGGGSGAAGDELDLELGGASAGAADGGDFDLDLEGESGAAGAGDDMLDLEIGAETASAAGDDLELGDLSGGGGAQVGEDMEALDLDLSDEGLDSLDLGAVEEGLEDMEPEAAEEPASDDPGMEEFQVESMEIPDEPVFDLDTTPAAAPAASADEEFHVAEDIRLDEEPLSLELNEVEPAFPGEMPSAEGMDTFELTEEAPAMLEPVLRPGPALEIETQTAAVAAAATQAPQEYVAVQDVQVDDDTLLELNLDDVEAGQMAEEDDSFMAHPAQAAPAMEEAIPLTEQLEIPPESQVQARVAQARAAARPVSAVSEGILNSEILMAVSHQIAVRLGSLSLNGRELLDIGYGSVLPLDRAIGEPVDLVLDNKTIAQGEVVLINGKNLGVRIVALNKQ